MPVGHVTRQLSHVSFIAFSGIVSFSQTSHGLTAWVNRIFSGLTPWRINESAADASAQAPTVFLQNVVYSPILTPSCFST